MDRKRITANSLLHDLLIFIKRPFYPRGFEQIAIKRKIWNIFRLWSLAIVIVLSLGWLIMYFIEVNGYDIANNAIVDFYETEPLLIIVLFALFWGPISEEITFRLGLKYSPFRLSFSLAFLLLLFVEIALEYCHDYAANWLAVFDIGYSHFAWLFCVAFVLIAGLGLGHIIKTKADQKKISSFYQKHFRIIFYFSASLFAVVHLLNYFDVARIWYLALMLVIPQFLIAIVLAYVRLWYGFAWSIFAHIIHNSLLSLPELMLGHLSKETIQILESPDAINFEKIIDKDILIIFVIIAFFCLILIGVAISIFSLFREYYKSSKCQKL